jgi:Sec-independent protein translocase protein TatA
MTTDHFDDTRDLSSASPKRLRGWVRDLAAALRGAREEIATLRRDVDDADDRVESLRMDLATVEREREETQEWALRVAEENARLRGIVEAVAGAEPLVTTDYPQEYVCGACGKGADATDTSAPDPYPHHADCPWLAARAYVDERARKEQP